MKKENLTNRSPKVLLVYLLMLSFVLVIVHILFKYISIVVFDEKHGFMFELSNRLDLNDENSVPQWFTQAMFLSIALLAYIASRFTAKGPKSKLWGWIAVFGLLLSIDDVATLHEFVLQSLHNTFFQDMASTVFVNSWMILLPFITVALGYFVYKAYKLLPRRTSSLIAVAGAVYLFGAVIVDSLTNKFLGQLFIEQGIMGAIEGGLQLIGSSLFLFAVYDYLDIHHRKQLDSLIAIIKPSTK